MNDVFTVTGHIVAGDEKVAALLERITCPISIHVREGKCKGRFEPLTIHGVKFIETGDGEFELDMSPEDLSRLKEFLEANDWQGQNG